MWFGHCLLPDVITLISNRLGPAFSCHILPERFYWWIDSQKQIVGNLSRRHALPETSRLWHLRLGILTCWLDASATLQLSLCHPCPLERKCHFDAFKHLGSDMRLWLNTFFSPWQKNCGGTCSNKMRLADEAEQEESLLLLSFFSAFPRCRYHYVIRIWLRFLHSVLLDPTFHK